MVSSLASAQPPSSTQPADTTLVPVPQHMQKDIPALRTRAELDAILGKGQIQQPSRELHVVLLAGPKDHGPGEHDYPAWQRAWHRLLSQAPKTRVTTAWEKPTEADLQSADVLVIFKHRSWPSELNESMEKFLGRGGGIVLFHFAVDCNQNADAGRHLGLYWGPGAKFRHGWLDLQFKAKGEDLLGGLAGRTFRFHDESYWRLTGVPEEIDVWATAIEDDGDGRQAAVPLLWNRQVGKGRVHVNILGHYNWTFNDPLFRVIALRGIAWAAGEPIDRFSPVVTTDVSWKE